MDTLVLKTNIVPGNLPRNVQGWLQLSNFHRLISVGSIVFVQQKILEQEVKKLIIALFRSYALTKTLRNI